MTEGQIHLTTIWNEQDHAELSQATGIPQRRLAAIVDGAYPTMLEKIRFELLGGIMPASWGQE